MAKNLGIAPRAIPWYCMGYESQFAHTPQHCCNCTMTLHKSLIHDRMIGLRASPIGSLNTKCSLL